MIECVLSDTRNAVHYIDKVIFGLTAAIIDKLVHNNLADVTRGLVEMEKYDWFAGHSMSPFLPLEVEFRGHVLGGRFRMSAPGKMRPWKVGATPNGEGVAHFSLAKQKHFLNVSQSMPRQQQYLWASCKEDVTKRLVKKIEWREGDKMYSRT